MLYSTQRDHSRQPVYKTRRCFLWKNQYFQLDIYNEPCHPRYVDCIRLDRFYFSLQCDVQTAKCSGITWIMFTVGNLNHQSRIGQKLTNISVHTQLIVRQQSVDNQVIVSQYRNQLSAKWYIRLMFVNEETTSKLHLPSLWIPCKVIWLSLLKGFKT